MKKICSVVLVCALCLGLCTPVFAVQSDNSRITETVAENGAIIRTLRRDNRPVAFSNSEATNFSETKADLVALGMNEIAIEEVSMNELQDYANSMQITTIEQYFKSDADGNVKYLPKEEALAASAQITVNDRVNYEDQYIRVVVIIAMISENEVRITTEANWLTEPSLRGIDALGCAAKYVDVFGSSLSGFITYSVNETKNGVSTTSRRTDSPLKTQCPSSGNFYGAGMTFRLPMDYKDPPALGSYEVKYTNIFAHFSYKGQIDFPSLPLNFNVTGTYTHRVISLGSDPSLSLSFKDSIASLIPIPTPGDEVYSSLIAVSYTP